MTNLLHKLSHLNIDRAKGAAPHKPLLLLCLLEIAAEGGVFLGTQYLLQLFGFDGGNLIRQQEKAIKQNQDVIYH